LNIKDEIRPLKHSKKKIIKTSTKPLDRLKSMVKLIFPLLASSKRTSQDQENLGVHNHHRLGNGENPTCDTLKSWYVNEIGHPQARTEIKKQ